MSLNSGRDEKLSSLFSNQIFAQSFKNFNDPYDGKMYCEDRHYFGQYSTGQDRVSHRRSAYCVSYSEILDFVLSSIKMWAHYAGDHAGFCIVFNDKLTAGLEEINTSALRECMATENIYGKILYEGSLPCYMPNRNIDNLSTLEAMFTKSLQW